MIVLMSPTADAATIQAALDKAAQLGLHMIALDGATGRGFEAIGKGRGRALELRGVPGVAEILTRRVAISGGEPLWPHGALRIGLMTLVVLALLVLLAAWFPPGLGDPASSGETIVPVAEWYLRLPELALGMAPSVTPYLLPLFWVVLLFWPFIDRFDPRSVGGRAAHRGLRLAVLALLLLIAWLAVAGGTP